MRDTYVGGAISPTDRLYYLTDANTNVTAVVGLSGSTWQVAGALRLRSVRRGDDVRRSRRLVDDWSNSLTASSVGNTLLYASMVLDPVTGLYYDEARWYSTAVSTFISRDPAQADVKLYRYCGNEPTISVDTSGCISASRSLGPTLGGRTSIVPTDKVAGNIRADYTFSNWFAADLGDMIQRVHDEGTFSFSTDDGGGASYLGR